MQAEIEVLLTAAIAISFLHTITGPDHYVPFLALAKTRQWSLLKTILWTSVCGAGHIGSSVLLGLGGAALGWSLSKISWLEGIRGGAAGWALIGFGLIYTFWGLYKVRPHKHFDINDDGSMYVYEHDHDTLVGPKERHVITPWVMFLIFVLGPCEPMIPLLYFPAAKNSWTVMLLLITVYTVFTLATMILMVILGYYGTTLLDTQKLKPYLHPLSGMAILLCGIGMVFMVW